MTNQEKEAIQQMNKALKALNKLEIRICGMDNDLLYATKRAIKGLTHSHQSGGSYCLVAQACQMDTTEETGKFKADCYEDSGGW